MKGGEEGGTSGNPLPAAFTEGDSKANRQDATHSQKRSHISVTNRGARVFLDRVEGTLRRQGH